MQDAGGRSFCFHNRMIPNVLRMIRFRYHMIWDHTADGRSGWTLVVDCCRLLLRTKSFLHTLMGMAGACLLQRIRTTAAAAAAAASRICSSRKQQQSACQKLDCSSSVVDGDAHTGPCGPFWRSWLAPSLSVLWFRTTESVITKQT